MAVEKVEQKEKKKLSESPFCTSALNAAKLIVKDDLEREKAGVTKWKLMGKEDAQAKTGQIANIAMRMRGADVGFEEIKEVTDKRFLKFWKDKLSFYEVRKEVMESVKGDVGEDNDYAVGVTEALNALETVLEKRWADEDEKKKQLKPLAQDIKILKVEPSDLVGLEDGVIKEGELDVETRAILRQDEEVIKEGTLVDENVPVFVPPPPEQIGKHPWSAEIDKRKKAEKDEKEERSDGRTGGGMRQEE